MTPEHKINWKHILSPSTIVLTVLGVLSATISFKGFMIPNHFMDGGVTGISILIHEVFHINVAIPLIIVNIPFLIIGYKKIGKTFALQSFLTIVILAACLIFINVPTITTDKFLIAVFGGLFIGVGIGLIIKAGGAIDGLEIIALLTNKVSVFTVNEIILFINGLLFASVAFFIGIESAMYSLLTFYTALQISKYVVDGFEQYTSLAIVSKEHEKVKELIVNKHDKAISVYRGERGYLPNQFDVREDVDIIVTIVTRLEIHKLENDIYECDPDAFMYIQTIKEVRGGVIKRLRKH